jgi:hypothetical protein
MSSAAVAVRRSSHMEVRAMCGIISTPVSGLLPIMDPDHGSVGSKGIVTLTSHLSKPWTLELATVDQSVPVIAKMDECVVEHSREPWTMLAHGTQSHILSEIEVGVIVQLHLKRRHKNVPNSISIAQKANTETYIKANSSK